MTMAGDRSACAATPLTSFRFSPGTNTAHRIHWREWGPEAFDEALRTDKLIVLCITAFWCGVCQRLDETALSAEEVQLLLNAYFIPIRVEESRRPDVDLRYTREGWPTIAFLTPPGEPILTVNFVDTETLIGLLVRMVDAHEKHRAEFSQVPLPPEPELAPTPDANTLAPKTVAQILELLNGLEDRSNGGFGGPEKYFYTDALAFYLHLGLRDHVEFTLTTLVNRAIHDARDGGFYRYSSQPD